MGTIITIIFNQEQLVELQDTLNLIDKDIKKLTKNDSWVKGVLTTLRKHKLDHTILRKFIFRLDELGELIRTDAEGRVVLAEQDGDPNIQDDLEIEQIQDLLESTLEEVVNLQRKEPKISDVKREHDAPSGKVRIGGETTKPVKSSINEKMKSQEVRGFYSETDVMVLIEALLARAELRRDKDGRIDESSQILAPKRTVLELGNVSEAEVGDIASEILKIQPSQQILIPVIIPSQQHWVTLQIRSHRDDTIRLRCYDSIGNRYEQEMVVLCDLLRTRLPEKVIAVGEAKTPTIQKGNVYCGGYTARLISNLVISKQPVYANIDIWNCRDLKDEDLRAEDLQIVNEIQPFNWQKFGNPDLLSAYECKSNAEQGSRLRTLTLQDKKTQIREELKTFNQEQLVELQDTLNLIDKDIKKLTKNDSWVKGVLTTLRKHKLDHTILRKFIFRLDELGELIKTDAEGRVVLAEQDGDPNIQDDLEIEQIQKLLQFTLLIVKQELRNLTHPKRELDEVMSDSTSKNKSEEVKFKYGIRHPKYDLVSEERDVIDITQTIDKEQLRIKAKEEYIENKRQEVVDLREDRIPTLEEERDLLPIIVTGLDNKLKGLNELTKDFDLLERQTQRDITRIEADNGRDEITIKGYYQTLSNLLTEIERLKVEIKRLKTAKAAVRGEEESAFKERIFVQVGGQRSDNYSPDGYCNHKSCPATLPGETKCQYKNAVKDAVSFSINKFPSLASEDELLNHLSAYKHSAVGDAVHQADLLMIPRHVYDSYTELQNKIRQREEEYQHQITQNESTQQRKEIERNNLRAEIIRKENVLNDNNIILSATEREKDRITLQGDSDPQVNFITDSKDVLTDQQSFINGEIANKEEEISELVLNIIMVPKNWTAKNEE
ncbi:hypothetical protein N3Z16_07260 [Candidatus Megaera polyxenophila]|uniref:hypothetical protein n=1 Tax=Candidatus Megaera polyxenophila TaxID=988779 RepID=UPI00249DC12F|nr:hypothetical protein N3Z16_07260 [Candidatus Megaera polyxenophila]